jgi:hypothetical protein
MIIRLLEGQASWRHWRRFLAVPPVISLLATLPLFPASIAAWGAADETGMPSWWPTAFGLTCAGFISVISLMTLARVRGRTVASFHLHLLSTFGGTVIMLTTAILTVLLTLGIDDPIAYEGIGADGEPLLGLGWTLIAWAIILAAWIGTFAGGAGIYVNGIEPTLKRYEKSPDEPDALGILIREEEEEREENERPRALTRPQQS